MTATTRPQNLAQEVTIAQAANLVGTSKQNIHKRLKGLALLQDRVSQSGPNKGRIEKVVRTEDLFKVYPEAAPGYQPQEHQSVGPQASGTPQGASQGVIETTVEEGGLACAKAWHVLAFRKFINERGMGRKRGLMFYCLAVKNGELALPAWVYQSKRSVSERSLERWEAAMSTGARSRAWRAMRVLRTFTLQQVAMTASISMDNVRVYVHRLQREGFARKIQNNVSGCVGHFAIWRLLKDTGPDAPIARKAGGLYDPNTQTTYIGGKVTAA
jgi:hypothetical protein